MCRLVKLFQLFTFAQDDAHTQANKFTEYTVKIEHQFLGSFRIDIIKRMYARRDGDVLKISKCI